MKSSTLIAYGLIDAASTTIPVANFVALPLFDIKGAAIPGNILPHPIGRIQFASNVGKNFILGQKNGAGATAYEHSCISQQDALDVIISAQQMGVKAFDADITLGKFVIYFFA